MTGPPTTRRPWPRPPVPGSFARPRTRARGGAQAGFAAALADGAEAVITLDGDGQHDPTEMAAFLGLYARRSIGGLPTELIVGRRSFRRMPPVRRLANWLGTVTLSAAVGRWVHDNQSGYRLIGRRLMTAMLDSRESGFAFEVEMIAVCLREAGRSAGFRSARSTATRPAISSRASTSASSSR